MRLRILPVAALFLALGAPPARGQASYEELQRFSDVLNHIRINYADSVNYRMLVHAAIDGMLASLDPHSWFLSREDNARFNALERGELATTGVTLELADGVPTVLDVADGSPADKAGVRPGDRIVSIDGNPTAGLNARTIALNLAGAKGTRVKVFLERGPRLEPDSISVNLKRDTPKPPKSVQQARMLDATTGYVRLHEFGPKSADEVRDAVRKLRGDKATRIVLDLRGNPGGIVTEAVAMASEFLPNNSLVFSTKGRQPSVNQSFRTKGDGEFLDIPLVVLTDQGSASAAEALSGSLQDHDRAVIAGRRTFGKALMQTAFMIPDGVVMLTIGHVISPSGRYIQRPYSGLKLQQYYAFAGDSAWQDTTRKFKTEHGRLVKGGGGIAPDIALPVPATMPRWFTVAADSGWDRAVSDSVGNTLGADAAARDAWRNGQASWTDRLLPPLLARVRERLHVTADLSDGAKAAIARRLAAQAAVVRWGEDAGEAISIGADPDVIAAVGLFARSREILGH